MYGKMQSRAAVPPTCRSLKRGAAFPGCDEARAFDAHAVEDAAITVQRLFA